MSPVMVLTDSTAYLPPDYIASLPIQVTPLTLQWDGESYRDGVDIQPGEFYARLSQSKTLPTTSQISTGEWSKNIQAALAKGYDVLILPISSGISGTYQAAASAAADFPAEQVAVMDTRLVSMALGFQVLAAARLAASGASLAECKQAAEQAYGQIGVYFYVDTLKYLAAGGRINSARRLLGTALNIKPVLAIQDGKIELVTSVRTQRNAIERMLDLVEQGIAGRTPVRISVFHAGASETAGQLMETTRQRFSPVEIIPSEVSPVIGSHVGPGTVSVAFQAGG